MCPMLELKNRLDSEHAAELKKLKAEHFDELQRVKELHLEEKVELLKGLCEKNAAAPKNMTTLITLRDLSELRSEEGRQQLRDLVTPEVVMGGQVELARVIRDANSASENPLYLCKDENRRKFQVLENGELKDDHFAERLIETLKDPWSAAISERVRSLLAEERFKEPDGQIVVQKKAVDCNNFHDKERNTKFVAGLARKNG